MSAPLWADIANIKSFTTTFGTVLHGSQITWYNNPEATDAASTDITEMKFMWVQNLYTRIYTFYDSGGSDDWYVGHFDVTGLSGAYAPGEAAADELSNIVFHIQFTNPVANDTPVLDGYRKMATFSMTEASTRPITATLGWSAFTDGIELVPAEDYDYATLDSATCSSGNDDLYTDYDSGDMCSESWQIGTEGWACVQVTGYMIRKMSTDANSVECDIDLDYVQHTIKIQMGAL